MKQCTRCKQFKDYSEFGKQADMLDGYRPQCKRCRCEIEKERRAQDPEAFRKAKNETRRNSPRQLESSRENIKRYRLTHPSAIKEWRQKNREKIAAYAKEYLKTHRVAMYNIRDRKRARLLGNGGSYTQQEWRDLCARYGNRCLCCKEIKPLTIDHVIPISKGGTNDISNIQPLCGSCNCKKYNKIIDYRPSS